MTQTQLAERAATLTLNGFTGFNNSFRAITLRAGKRFKEQDWSGGQQDARERLDLYEKTLDTVLQDLYDVLGTQAWDQSIWIAAKEEFGTRVADRYDVDRAETFFNSVTRKILMTIGVNREVEFFYLHAKPPARHSGDAIHRSYGRGADTAPTIKRILEDAELCCQFLDIDHDAQLIAQEVDLYLWPLAGAGKAYDIEVVKSIFYRNQEAYIIGRIMLDSRPIPLIIPLSHASTGLRAETVLLHESEATILFSFAYSYFFVDIDRYDLLIDFLRSIIPQAQLSELYTSLGYNRHGKTEFYRDLHRFVHISKETFIIAPGLEGAVMIAFTLPNFDFVFKVIKDKPGFIRSQATTAKTIRKHEVRSQYTFVSHRDRAGRLVDTQEFANLRFRRKRFSEQLLAEFAQAARGEVVITEEFVVIQHAYVQRKVIPLPLYFENEKDPEAIRHVLIDFGFFLKDIAASRVFPCDLFNTWNYGVTHWGRVVLYDYDDVLPIERIRFRKKPLPRTDFEETEPEENWITATEEDFFIDEMDRYSGIPRPLKGVFRSVHGDLYTLDFWDDLIARLNNGEVFDVVPYDRAKRFHTSWTSGRRPPAI